MVVIVNDVFSLIVVLEIMTLAFGYLALFKHTLYQDEKEAEHATAEEEKECAHCAADIFDHQPYKYRLLVDRIFALGYKCA